MKRITRLAGFLVVVILAIPAAVLAQPRARRVPSDELEAVERALDELDKDPALVTTMSALAVSVVGVGMLLAAAGQEECASRTGGTDMIVALYSVGGALAAVGLGLTLTAVVLWEDFRLTTGRLRRRRDALRVELASVGAGAGLRLYAEF